MSRRVGGRQHTVRGRRHGRSGPLVVVRREDGSVYSSLRTPAVRGANGEVLEQGRPVYEALDLLDKLEEREENRQKRLRGET